MLEVHSMVVTKLTDECDCKSVNECHHNTWEANCPSCGRRSLSSYIFGPYNCEECRDSFMVSVEGWVAPLEDMEKENG